jgi:hypothetical protein
MSVKLDELDPAEHKHTPYITILIQALEIFKANPSGGLPSKTAEYNYFKEIISKLQRNQDEDNFNEAKVYYYYCKKDKLDELTPEVEDIFALLEANPLKQLFTKSNNVMSAFFAIFKAVL